MYTLMTRGNKNRKKQWKKMKWEASSSEIQQKDTYNFCCLYWWEQSVLFSVSASPMLAVPPTMLSSRGCGDKGPSEMYSGMHHGECVLLTSALARGRVLALDEWMDGWGREGRELFFLFLLLLYLYRGFIAVLKDVRSYLHSLGLVTETNKNNILLMFFSDVWFLLCFTWFLWAKSIMSEH